MVTRGLEGLSRSAFGRQVRDALAHLYDLPYLQSHALVAWLPRTSGLRRAPGQALERRLREAVDQLRPGPETPATGRAWRRYRLFTMRYVDALETPEVCRELGISQSEYYREHQLGLETIVSILSGELNQPATPPPSTPRPARWEDASGLATLLYRPGQSPFVGRAAELGFLREEFEAVASGGGGRLVLITGEAGVGKTRLVRQLAEQVRVGGAKFLEGRYLREEGTPFGPWGEILREGMRGISRDEAALAVGPYAGDLLRVFPELEAQLGEETGEATSLPGPQLGLYSGIAHVLDSLSQWVPLIVLVNDLQWAPGLSLLAHLARRLKDSRILLIGAYREHEFNARLTLAQEWADLNVARLFAHIRLQPLGADQTRALVAQQFGDEVAGTLASRVHQATQGNPFFIEEVLRSLAEHGAIRYSEDHWEAAGPLAITLPRSVQLLLEERLAGMRQESRDVLEQAAVLGQSFSFAVLQEMTGREEEDLLGPIDQGITGGLLHDTSSPEEERYTFVDPQVQQVLYEGISPPRRRRLHRRAARALEALHGSEHHAHPEELARHFAEGNEPEQAAAYAFRAGDEAEAAAAWPRAIELYRLALETWERLGEREQSMAEAYQRLGDVTWQSASDPARGIEYFQRALDLYQRVGDLPGLAAVHARMARDYAFSGNLQVTNIGQAMAHYHEARALLEQTDGENTDLGLVYAGLAVACGSSLQLGEAEAWADKTIEAGGSGGGELAIVNTAVPRALAFMASGRVSAALATLEEGWAIASRGRHAYQADFIRTVGVRTTGIQLKDPVAGLAWAARVPDFHTLGSLLELPAHLIAVYALLGDLNKGRVLWEQLRRDLDALGQPPFGHSPMGIGLLLTRHGEWEPGRELLQAGLAWATQSGVRSVTCAVLHRLGDLSLDAGDGENALKYLLTAWEEYRQAGACLLQVGLLPGLSKAQCQLGRPDTAAAYVEEVQHNLSHEDLRGLAGDLALARGITEASLSRWPEADNAFQEALLVAQRYKLRWDEARACYEWGAALAARGEASRARSRELIGTALAGWEGIGAQPYAERCRELLAISD